MQCLWHPVLHFQSAEDILRKIPAWLPLQIQNTSPPVLEEDSRLSQTKANDSVGGWLMRPLHITKSVESPVSYKLTSVYFQLLILKHGILFSNSSSTNRFLLLHSHFYTGIPSHYIHHFIVKGSSSPFPVANTHPQLLLKLHPDFGVCHIHLPSVPCDNFSIFFT